jgi:hypothetical protein
VSFKDQSAPKAQIAEIHIVESYKEYNVVEKNKHDKKDLGKKVKKDPTSCDCIIF